MFTLEFIFELQNEMREDLHLRGLCARRREQQQQDAGEANSQQSPTTFSTTCDSHCVEGPVGDTDFSMTKAATFVTGDNDGKHRRRRRSIEQQRRIFGFQASLLSFLVVLTMLLCLEHLRHDIVFSDMVTSPMVHTIWDVKAARRPILRGSSGISASSLSNDQFLQALMVHDLKALVHGDDEGSGQQSKDVVGGALNVIDDTEEVELYNNVRQAFAKRDARFHSTWWNANKVVHVIHTRVLQNQPRLVDYTKARLEQFQTFTLPSIRAQTNNEFLWILWTDPSLTAETEQQLRDLLVGPHAHKMENVVIIGYKKKRHDIKSPWFHKTFDQSYMFGGSYKLLMSYHKAATEPGLGTIVLNTYLDSDDALSSDFVQLLQQEAVQALSSPILTPSGTTATKPPLPKVRFWCPAQIVEWEYFTPPWQLAMENRLQGHYNSSSNNNNNTNNNNLFHNFMTNDDGSNHNQGVIVPGEEKGYFSMKSSYDKCVSSAGSTIGVSQNVSIAHSFPMFADMKDRLTWHEKVLPCEHATEANCLGFLTRNGNQNNNDYLSMLEHATVLRARTIIGAEQKSIPYRAFPLRPKPSVEAAVHMQHAIWRQLPLRFGIPDKSIPEFRSEFQRNLDKILLDMLTICLPNNACKVVSKQTLQELLATIGLRKKQEQPLPQVPSTLL